MTTSEQDDLRPLIGAEAALDAEIPDHVPGNLPMIVWLRGDESLCAEFIVDADEVMRQLGIRRSRLTQISGRELRVGRMRRGRYVSPVYRQVDVDAYQQWTRATASHLKSSAVLNDAADQLLRQGATMTDRLDGWIRELAPGLTLDIRRSGAETVRLVVEELAHIRSTIAGAERRMLAGEERLKQALVAQRSETAELRAALDRQSAALAVQVRELAELTALARIERVEQETTRALLASNAALLEVVLGRLPETHVALPPPLPRPAPRKAEGRRIGKALAAPLSEAPLPGTRLTRLAAGRKRRRMKSMTEI